MIGVRFRVGGLGIFFNTMSKPALGSTQPPIQWVPGALSLGVKQPGHEADHQLHLVLKAKNACSCTSTPPVCLHGAYRISMGKPRGECALGKLRKKWKI
jgi:hypothetical protein